MVRKRKFDSPTANTAVTEEKREKFEKLSIRKSIITKIMTRLDLFTVIVMEEFIGRISVLILKISVKLVRIIIVNLTAIRRIFRRI